LVNKKSNVQSNQLLNERIALRLAWDRCNRKAKKCTYKGKGTSGSPVIGNLRIYPIVNFCGFKHEFHWIFCKNSLKRDDNILMKWKTGSPIDVNFIRQMLCVCVEAETVQAKDLFYLILIGNSSREAGQKRSQLEVRQSGSPAVSLTPLCKCQEWQK